MQLPEASPQSNPDQAQGISRLERKLDDLLSLLEPVPYPAAAADQPPTGLLSYWQTLQQRKLIIVLAGIFVACAAWYFSNNQPRLYKAHLTLEILEPDRGSMNMANFNSGGGSIAAQATYLTTQYSLLRSKSLLTRVGKRLLAQGAIAKEDVPTDADSVGPEHESSVLSVDLIGVAPVRETRLVELSYSATEPKLAATIVNNLAAEYIQQDIDTRVNTSEETRTWLQKQLEDTKEKLESSEGNLQKYAKSSGLLYTSPKGDVAEQTDEKLQFLARDLADAQAKRVNLEAKYETFVKSPDAKVDESDSSTLHQIQSSLLDLSRQRATLSSLYTPEYSKVKELDAQIATLREGEAKEYNRWLAQLFGAYKTELNHEKLLGIAYDQQTGIVNDQAAKAIHYNVLKREVETNRNLYDALLAGMKQAGVNAAARVRNARIVDAAQAPRGAYSPRPVLTASAGLMAGLMLGAVFVFITEIGDRRLKSPGMAPSYLNVPELGVIPSTKPHLLPTARRAYLVSGGTGTPVDTGVGLGRFTRNQPALKGSAVFEAFHSAVTSILSPSRSSNVPQVLVVTSGSVHEGKSTVIGNLALMAAEIGQRVILVDGDLRNPRLHQIYDVPNQHGLTDLLLEPDKLVAGALTGRIQKTEVPSLFLLPSGPFTDDVASMLHSQRLEEIVFQLRTEFDLILIDTPPVLPFADARVFGKLADAVILVVRAGRTTRDLALAAKARFVEDGLPVFGTILNDWNGKSRSYEYGGERVYKH